MSNNSNYLTSRVPKLVFSRNNEFVNYLLKDIIHVFDGTHKTPKYFENGIKFYSVEYITKNEFKYIDNEQYKQLSKKFNPEEFDILFSRIGEIGKTKIINKNDDLNFAIYVSISLLRIKDKFRISPLYIKYYLDSPWFQKILYKNSLINASPKKINIEDLLNVIYIYMIRF